MLARRVVTAAIGIPIVVTLIVGGGWILTVGAALLASLGIREVSRMFAANHLIFFPRLAVVWVWALFLAQRWHVVPLLAVVTLGVVATAMAGVVLGRQASSFQGVLTTTWAGLYLGLFFSFVVAIRQLPHGRVLTIGFFLVVWITDTMAYFVGRQFGRAKILPHISPQKTWAGTVGGTVSAVMGAIGLGYLVHIGHWQAGLFGLLVSVTAQLGDFLESQLKRYTGVKDSGGLLPGHGGILDRFDSILFALPVAYYLLKGLGIS